MTTDYRSETHPHFPTRLFKGPIFIWIATGSAVVLILFFATPFFVSAQAIPNRNECVWEFEDLGQFIQQPSFGGTITLRKTFSSVSASASVPPPPPKATRIEEAVRGANVNSATATGEIRMRLVGPQPPFSTTITISGSAQQNVSKNPLPCSNSGVAQPTGAPGEAGASAGGGVVNLNLDGVRSGVISSHSGPAECSKNELPVSITIPMFIYPTIDLNAHAFAASWSFVDENGPSASATANVYAQITHNGILSQCSIPIKDSINFSKIYPKTAIPIDEKIPINLLSAQERVFDMLPPHMRGAIKKIYFISAAEMQAMRGAIDGFTTPDGRMYINQDELFDPKNFYSVEDALFHEAAHAYHRQIDREESRFKSFFFFPTLSVLDYVLNTNIFTSYLAFADDQSAQMIANILSLLGVMTPDEATSFANHLHFALGNSDSLTEKWLAVQEQGLAPGEKPYGIESFAQHLQKNGESQKFIEMIQDPKTFKEQLDIPKNGCAGAYGCASVQEDIAELYRMAMTKSPSFWEQYLQADPRIGQKLNLLHDYGFLTSGQFQAITGGGQ